MDHGTWLKMIEIITCTYETDVSQAMSIILVYVFKFEE